ncbi:relaxase/mobilization nuclease domain-containing protein (plasmid) [Leifsonia sp. ZF2019]|uniref:relaxase/mobilization nuclease domain-containing protein n=1 Tax=Leifsonia sp. ZF2019 TaxID=2781978 RepID=UPI001CBA8766|nr:relaxase/mobilization nuclease domain-containing protein [Leifsonia sp. ZF2019]UAJ81716.1 relaxase/mobilization nuclease domain-containing protein [Leifsonia sp. ZF2019]
MPVIKMWQIKRGLAKALERASDPQLTGGGLWISVNAAVIDPSNIAAIVQQFGETVQSVGVTRPRTNSVAAHHLIQSFDPAVPVPLEVVHRVGVQLAERVTGGEHEYVVATHVAASPVCNHIIFNPVSFESGRRFRVGRGTIGLIRTVSDELYEAEGLPVLSRRADGSSSGVAL